MKNFEGGERNEHVPSSCVGRTPVIRRSVFKTPHRRGSFQGDSLFLGLRNLTIFESLSITASKGRCGRGPKSTQGCIKNLIVGDCKGEAEIPATWKHIRRTRKRDDLSSSTSDQQSGWTKKEKGAKFENSHGEVGNIARA